MFEPVINNPVWLVPVSTVSPERYGDEEPIPRDPAKVDAERLETVRLLMVVVLILPTVAVFEKRFVEEAVVVKNEVEVALTTSRFAK